MNWVDMIARAVSWRSLDLEVSWREIEWQLGVQLPSDYKLFCECFGAGQFSGYLEVYSSSGGTDCKILQKLRRFHNLIEQHPVTRKVFEPHGLFTPDIGGLIPWGMSVTATEYYWLARPDAGSQGWPLLIREESGDWQRSEISMTEFIFRMLTDESFADFGIADLVAEPFYESAT